MHMHANHTELENGGNVIFHTSHTTSELISLGLIGTVSNDCTKSAFSSYPEEELEGSVER